MFDKGNYNVSKRRCLFLFIKQNWTQNDFFFANLKKN